MRIRHPPHWYLLGWDWRRAGQETVFQYCENFWDFFFKSPSQNGTKYQSQNFLQTENPKKLLGSSQLKGMGLVILKCFTSILTFCIFWHVLYYKINFKTKSFCSEKTELLCLENVTMGHLDNFETYSKNFFWNGKFFQSDPSLWTWICFSQRFFSSHSL